MIHLREAKVSLVEIPEEYALSVLKFILDLGGLYSEIMSIASVSTSSSLTVRKSSRSH